MSRLSIALVVTQFTLSAERSRDNCAGLAAAHNQAKAASVSKRDCAGLSAANITLTLAALAVVSKRDCAVLAAALCKRRN